MTDILQERLAPSPDAVESAVGDETVILHMKSGTYFGLDSMGTRIWTLLKDGSLPQDICRHLAEEFDVAQEQAEADARRFLNDLKDHAIIVAADPRSGD